MSERRQLGASKLPLEQKGSAGGKSRIFYKNVKEQSGVLPIPGFAIRAI